MRNILDPRGIRNNNPGNLRLSKTVWQGQQKSSLQVDPDFAEFTAPLYGLRALMKTLVTYYLRYDLDTVQSVINRFAPPHENDTESYARAVAKALKVDRFYEIKVTSKQTLIALTQAIVLQEHGKPPGDRPLAWYDPALYDQAAILVLNGAA